MILHDNSELFNSYGDEYFDAPDWDGTATYEEIRLTEVIRPFDYASSGLAKDVNSLFQKKGLILEENDANDQAALINNYFNEYNSRYVSYIILQDNHVVLVTICKDEKRAGNYRMDFIFDRERTPLNKP